VPGKLSIRQNLPEIGNDCSAKTVAHPDVLLLTFKPSGATLTIVFVRFHLFPWALQSLVVLKYCFHKNYYFLLKIISARTRSDFFE
jgi:hypothetical protein